MKIAMKKERSNSPFYDWIPRPVGILILLFMFVPPTFSGGAYLCNSAEMSGSLAFRSEDIQLASIFTSIGMCLFPPFMLRFLQIRRVKQTYLYCFLLLIPLNYICAVTTSMPLLLTACLLIGFVRCIVMLNCTFTIAPYLTGIDTLAMFTMKEEPPVEVQYQLERKRTFLMPVLYGFILLISQISNMLTAWFAYNYSWQDAYYVVIVMLIAALVLVISTMPSVKSNGKYTFERRKIWQMLLMSITLCSMAYLLVYGKISDWFDSDNICISLAVMLLSGGLLLYLFSNGRDDDYLPIKVFKYRNVLMSMLLFLLVMIFNSANMFTTMFVKLTTSIDNLQSAMLGKWQILGYVVGLVLSIFLIFRKVSFKIIFGSAFFIMALSNMILYFQYQTDGYIDNMIPPIVLNAVGLLMLYSVVAAFGMKKLPARYLVAFVFLMIWMRNVIAPAVGSSLYSNMMQNRQQYYVASLAGRMNNENYIMQSELKKGKQVGMLSGKNTLESEQIATSMIYRRTLQQSTIVAMKDITGQTAVLLLGTTLLVMLLPYYKHETT